MRSRTKRGALLVSVLAVLFVASCGADPSDVTSDGGDTADRVSNKITGSVGEWFVDVSAAKAEAGEVTFAIANFGTVAHEFLVVETMYAPGKIPVGANDRFDEQDPGIDVVDEIAEWSPNDAEVLRVTLERGRYELVCNLEGHYANGMWTSLVVD